MLQTLLSLPLREAVKYCTHEFCFIAVLNFYECPFTFSDKLGIAAYIYCSRVSLLHWVKLHFEVQLKLYLGLLVPVGNRKKALFDNLLPGL